MKKFLLALALAAAILAAGQQTASAWTSFKLGIGANIEYQGGGNSILWGALCSSPTPGCNPFGGCAAPGYCYPPCPMPSFALPAFDCYGMAGQGFSYGNAAQGMNHQAIYYAPNVSYGYYPATSYGYGW